VLGHPMTSPRYVREVLRPAVERGARAAGRPASEVSISTGVVLQVDDGEPDLARREAAAQLGFYATTRTYAPVLALHGFEGLIGPLREAFGRGDLAGMAAIALPMVDTLAVAGTAGECRERLAAFEAVVDRIILGGTWVGPSPERIAANHRAIVRAFAPR
jgi:alkanesulfonate monooxygenase SsuD/methylene tetrahydromethanopterin reductase-like flavin-dependent oxidoreductase (luciferase family)